MNDFPPRIKQFIDDHLDSVTELELLLLLRSNPSCTWTAQEAGATLYATTEAMALLMGGLSARGLLKSHDGDRFAYQPTTPELASLVDELADLYRQRRATVITLIYSKPMDKIRSFADAFRFRKGS